VKEIAGWWQLQVAYLHLRLGDRKAAQKICAEILAAAPAPNLRARAEYILGLVR
jgi:hypothetical protein